MVPQRSVVPVAVAVMAGLGQLAVLIQLPASVVHRKRDSVAPQHGRDPCLWWPQPDLQRVRGKQVLCAPSVLSVQSKKVEEQWAELFGGPCSC